ncbi:MAG: helix-turn-helix domain-containing protein [Acidimicrobiia bacterium]|nr:helix-turn-helix domain-containing protein [Acidimicrobiia bacterium]MDX2468107.1 helix-turn-helix domain-containing protein [Acidimicrobiia bacterium]
MDDAADTVFAALQPLLDAIGGDPVDASEVESGDIPINWDGKLVGAIRLPPLSHALELLVSRIELEMGAPLADLDRVAKQVAVRMLDEQGAFLLRKSIEYVADAMDVSRITIYNYLNAIKD